MPGLTCPRRHPDHTGSKPRLMTVPDGTATPTSAQRVLVAGGSGLIGTAVRRRLLDDGHEVIRLVRRPARTASEFSWSPSSGIMDGGLIDSVDAVINLSGAPTVHVPWTRRYKLELVQSRIDATLTLATAISRSPSPPKALINASAVGYYGDRPGEQLDENSPKGTGFLSDLAESWERTAHLVPDQVRVVTLRTGLVVGAGDAFNRLGLFVKMGLGFRIGSGRDFWPWISLHDEAAAIVHLLGSAHSGPVNLAGPTPATSDQVTRAFARAIHRWRPWVVPEALVRLVLREPGRELILQDQRMVPRRLLDDGFHFRDETVDVAMDLAFGR
jgi:uncharacterized protein